MKLRIAIADILAVVLVTGICAPPTSDAYEMGFIQVILQYILYTKLRAAALIGRSQPPEVKDEPDAGKLEIPTAKEDRARVILTATDHEIGTYTEFVRAVSQAL